MIIDPVCSLAFEGAPEAPDLMRRPPRRSDAGIVGWPMLWQGLTQGGCLLLATLGVYALALQAGREPDVARALAIIGLTAGNLLLVAANTSAGSGLRALLDPSARAFWAAPSPQPLNRYCSSEAGFIVIEKPGALGGM